MKATGFLSQVLSMRLGSAGASHRTAHRRAGTAGGAAE